jgi:formamidopyrimidine-DNA glycosylase
MVEGHQVHRVCHAHRKLLVGHKFLASSPNGRFTDGAALINAATLSRVEAVGKNLFYFFSPANASSASTSSSTTPNRRPSTSEEAAEWARLSVPQSQVVMHVHFGMSGAFATFSRDKAPPPKPTTRLELKGLPGTPAEPIVAHLSAMTVQHGIGGSLFAERVRALGPDPLRDDADASRFFTALERAAPSKPVGLMLMDQSIVCGVGNIYRAEILFKSRVHPEQPAAALPRSAAERLWRHSRDLLRRGFETGSILTVDPEDATRLGKPWTRRYVYNQSTCGECGGRVSSWDMANRTCYACARCQPLVGPGEDPLERSHAEVQRKARAAEEGGGGGGGSGGKKGAAATSSAATAVAAGLAPARRAALAAATPAKTFKSHCAPDHDAADEAEAAAASGKGAAAVALLLQKLTVAELRGRLAGLEGEGGASAASSLKKAALVERLAETMVVEAAAKGKKKGDEPAAVPTPERSQRQQQQQRRRPRGGRGAEDDSRSSGSEDGVDRADAALARANAPPKRFMSLLAPTESEEEEQEAEGERRVASAREAALEKLRAGEHRGVEHVALVDDGVLEVIEEEAKAKKAKKGKKPAAAAARASKRARR